jgi:serine/threonine protein kinase/tetratricopeptide (TPR) repeat protein
MPVAAGQRLGPYEIVEPLGAGGMGEVYRARDSRLGREVAVKVIPAHLANAADALARFEREARAVAALSHPNILAIHDYGREGSVSYAVMELLQGETLRDRLADSALPARKAVEYAQQIARGLAAAHDRGIVHRDLKPENVFLTRDGLVKILDFGLASPTPSSTETPISRGVVTETGTVVGTPGYMSPEQIRGKEVDARSDLFALGAILFEMLTGRRAFSKESPVETMMAVLQDEPGFATSGRAVPQAIVPVLSHCLEKNPEDRFQSARDLVFALQVVERDVDSAARGTPSGAFGSGEGASIAVLPFRNLSADPTAAYFSDGITEEITNALTSVASLRVAARTSSFAFKGRDVDVRQIGRELGVRTVLEGSVRQAGQRLRITAQLVDVSNGYHIWSERYDREMQDVFAVQDEIARTIVAKLSPKLLGVPEEPLIEAPTSDVAAYDLYLKGRFLWNVRRPKAAIEQFEAAIARDPRYAAAHLGIADSYSVWGFYGGIPTWEAYARARAAAEKAQELAPDSPEVHRSLGIIEHYYGWDVAREERELRLAIAANPRDSDAHFWLALCLCLCSGKEDDARSVARQGVALEPHSGNAQTALGWVPAARRRWAEALPDFEKAVETSPTAVFPLWSLGYAQHQLGRFDDAVKTLARVVQVTDRAHFYEMALYGAALRGAGRTEEAGAVLAELESRATREYVPPLDRALLLSAFGRREDALQQLERAYEERNALMWFRIHLPYFDPLATEPRYRALAEKLARLAPVAAELRAL